MLSPAFLFFLACLCGVDLYTWQAAKVFITRKSPRFKRRVRLAFFIQAATALLLTVSLRFIQSGTVPFNFLLSFIFMGYLAKLLMTAITFFDDIRRALKWFFKSRKRRRKASISGQKIPRSKFLARSAVLTAALPIVTMSFGILSGAYDYRVRRRKIYLPNLPRGFEGIRLAQLSDIHSGSFFNKKAVMGGIDLLLAEKPDMIFFTGDLVNNETKEVNEYFDLFTKVKADLGVFSTLGNHDYGDYRAWSSVTAKQQNMADMLKAHRRLGWRLLMNENQPVRIGQDQIAVLGVENWGTKFVKHGRLDQASLNAEGDVKLLLSHDPSHWDAQIRIQQPDIDITFSGHTHGMQFGVEIGDFRWSPSQYIYKQWADLYRKGKQYLYVNRGYGFLAFPGRIGILPEITIFQLTGKPLA